MRLGVPYFLTTHYKTKGFDHWKAPLFEWDFWDGPAESPQSIGPSQWYPHQMVGFIPLLNVKPNMHCSVIESLFFTMKSKRSKSDNYGFPILDVWITCVHHIPWICPEFFMSFPWLSTTPLLGAPAVQVFGAAGCPAGDALTRYSNHVLNPLASSKLSGKPMKTNGFPENDRNHGGFSIISYVSLFMLCRGINTGLESTIDGCQLRKMGAGVIPKDFYYDIIQSICFTMIYIDLLWYTMHNFGCWKPSMGYKPAIEYSKMDRFQGKSWNIHRKPGYIGVSLANIWEHSSR